MCQLRGGNSQLTFLRNQLTDANTYSPVAVIPPTLLQNIPYNLAYKILRICSEKENLIKRLGEMTNLLITRENIKKRVDEAISRVLKISIEEVITGLKTGLSLVCFSTFRGTQNLRSKQIKVKPPFPPPHKREKREQLGIQKCN